MDDMNTPQAPMQGDGMGGAMPATPPAAPAMLPPAPAPVMPDGDDHTGHDHAPGEGHDDQPTGI